MTCLDQDPPCGWVEVLTDAATGATVGFHIDGHHAGPRLVVAGFNPVAGLTFDRLLSLPTLGWMRGSLTLLTVNDVSGAIAPHRYLERADELHFLPYTLRQAEAKTFAGRGYWEVLRICSNLFMISGRGVPSATISERAR